MNIRTKTRSDMIAGVFDNIRRVIQVVPGYSNRAQRGGEPDRQGEGDRRATPRGRPGSASQGSRGTLRARFTCRLGGAGVAGGHPGCPEDAPAAPLFPRGEPSRSRLRSWRAGPGTVAWRRKSLLIERCWKGGGAVQDNEPQKRRRPCV